MTEKPQKTLHDCFIVGNRLYGIRPDFVGKVDTPTTCTSTIVSQNGNTVETKNTVYTVNNWHQGFTP